MGHCPQQDVRLVTGGVALKVGRGVWIYVRTRFLKGARLSLQGRTVLSI